VLTGFPDGAAPEAGAVRVVKLGGNALDRPGWLDACAAAIARSPGPVVVVHGGGRAITDLSERLGLPVGRQDGLRITTPAVAAVVEMTLAGPANRTVVAALRRAGVDAIGLSGVDGGLLVAEPLDPRLGCVGAITAVRVPLLERLLVAGLTPVVAPMAPTAAGDGVPLNVNADDAAAAIAGALGAAELLLVSDVGGVVVAGEARRLLDVTELPALIAEGVVTEGMIAKVRAASAALAAGARATRVGGVEMLATPAAGTRLVTTAARAA
jgi:acetylglutamate kinase